MSQVTKFEIGKTYRGVSGVGYCSIEVVKRTEKTITVKTSFGENRIKIRSYRNDEETAIFKSWSFGATDIYTQKKQSEDLYESAYY